VILISDAGCWADGAGGHDRIRMVMANTLATLYRHHPRGGEGVHWPEVSEVCEALDSEMSDDAWEEDEALEWLNRACEDGCWFEFVDGDLMLVSEGMQP
jgi:hypothetical protein